MPEPPRETTAPSSEVVPDDSSDASPTTEQYQAIDASVVPVPVESLNRLVLAVDELGSEMVHVREAIRELTATLSESQAGFARIVAGQAHANGSTAPDPLTLPDPLEAVTGPYVSGAPSPTPFTAPPAVAGETPPAFDPASLAPRSDPAPAAAPPAPAFSFPESSDPRTPTPEHANGLGDLPIVSTGEVQVVIGPIGSLDELDDAVDHIRRINGVTSVSVSSFEGAHVVLTGELSRALPLASLLRTEIGRDVTSCRLVDGRIVVDFGEAGPRA